MNAFVVNGIWWFPNQLDSRFEGELCYSLYGGARLKPTSGNFMKLFMKQYGEKNSDGALSFSQGSELQNVPVLLGVAEGRQFTLLHCGLYPHGAVVGLIVDGRHFDRIEDAVFPAYSMSFSGLDEWGASGRLESRIEENANGTHNFKISYEMPPDPDRSLTVELKKVYLRIIHSTLFLRRQSNRAELVENTEFKILPKPNNVLSVTDAIELYSNLLRNFLMLSTWKYITPLYIRAWNNADDIAEGQVSLYWRTKGMELEKTEYTGDFLFTMQDIKNNLGSVLRNWEENREIFQPFIRNYFSHRYTSETFVEVQFLSYIEAVEAYHKKKYAGKDNLKDRIKYLLDSIQRYSHMRIIIGDNSEKLAEDLKNVRNDLVHEADLKISPTRLIKYTQHLELIILTVIYEALGFSDELIEEVSQYNRGFQKRLN